VAGHSGEFHSQCPNTNDIDLPVRIAEPLRLIDLRWLEAPVRQESEAAQDRKPPPDVALLIRAERGAVPLHRADEAEELTALGDGGADALALSRYSNCAFGRRPTSRQP
jgi:hypothetical protein